MIYRFDRFREASCTMRSLSLLAFCVVGPAFAADPPSGDTPPKAAAAKSPAGEKILTPAQLRDCLAQQQKMKQQDAEADGQKQALATEKAEIARLGEALAAQLAALDRTDAAAVNAYNERAQARDTRIDAYEASIERYNARATALNADHDAFAKSCNNRRFLEDDETAIKKGK